MAIHCTLDAVIVVRIHAGEFMSNIFLKILELELALGERMPPIEYQFVMSKFVKPDDVFVMERDMNNFLVVSGTMLSENLILASIGKFISTRNEHNFKSSIETEWKSLMDDEWFKG